MGNTIIGVAFVALIMGVVGYYYVNYKTKNVYRNQRQIYENGVNCGINSITELYDYFVKAQNLEITNITFDGVGILTVVRNGEVKWDVIRLLREGVALSKKFLIKTTTF